MSADALALATRALQGFVRTWGPLAPSTRTLIIEPDPLRQYVYLVRVPHQRDVAVIDPLPRKEIPMPAPPAPASEVRTIRPAHLGLSLHANITSAVPIAINVSPTRTFDSGTSIPGSVLLTIGDDQSGLDFSIWDLDSVIRLRGCLEAAADFFEREAGS